jgi:cytochrome c556
MNRLTVVVALTACVVGAAWADIDVIAQRRALMKGDGVAGKALYDMTKGAPFDFKIVQTSLKTFADVAAMAPTLFPDNSKTGGGTNALPAIWENKADFDARFAKFGSDAAAALKNITDEASFKANIQPVLSHCGSCHELYKARSG